MKKRDKHYFSYLSPAQAGVERTLNAVYILLMIGTFIGAFVIAVISPRDDSTMTFLGMFMCEICLIIMRRGTIPLFEIRFDDYHTKPRVKMRDNTVLLWIGLGFLLFIGYLMMAVGVVNFIVELNENRM